MTQAKTQAAQDIPVFSENKPHRDTIKAQSAIRAKWDELHTLRAVSDDLAKAGHKFSTGYLSLVLNGLRPASRELLIALGIRKPRKVLTPAEREARKERRAIVASLLDLYSLAHAGNEIRFVRAGVAGGWWNVRVYNLSGNLQHNSEYEESFAKAAQKATE